MSFCASDWEVHGFSGAFPSNCKTKPNFSIEAPLVPDDVFEELYWENGQLKLYQKQLSSWASNAPAQATRDHGVAPLHLGGYPASLNNNVDTIAALSLPHFDPYTSAQNSLHSLARLAAEWEPDAGVPCLQAVVDGAKRIHQCNKGACMSTDSSLESTVTGISLQGPNLLIDPHVTNCVKAESVTLHQVDEAVPIERPDATTRTDALCVLHPMGMCRADGGDIKTFSKRNRSDKSGDFAKRKAKDSDGSESPSKDLANRSLFSQGFSSKRSRAAEIHNKSERKRRERINKKLKVLQELIPNPNKTDKASLLGQAIEYLKALQAQIMVMSYRTGITIPPTLMSHDMLQAPHMGMGFGGGFFMNTNAKDVAGVATPVYSSMRKASSLKPLLPSPALPSPARLVGTGNDASKHLVGCSANYFPMANVGLVRPPYQLQTHNMPVHHKAPSFL